MIMSNVIVKVTNKNKDGVTVTSLDGRIVENLSWKDFDENFKFTGNGFLYEMIDSPEIRVEVEEMTLRWDWLKPHIFNILRIINKKQEELTIDDYGLLGHIEGKYHKEFTYTTPADFIRDIQEIKKMLSG